MLTRACLRLCQGDGNIRYFELSDAAPFVFPLSEYRTSVSAKGLHMLPKRVCNPLKARGPGLLSSCL